MGMGLVHEELSYSILGCAFAVYNELGPFFRESIYQQAMEIALDQAGLSFERQKNVPIEFRGVGVGRGILDLVVENRILLELKAVETLYPVFESQLIQYLTATGMELGFLLNFGKLGHLQYKRLLLSIRGHP